MIAFFSDRDGNDEIYVMNADGSDQRNLTHHPASDTDPSWSPDGSLIAFSSTRDRNYEIYVMDADGGNLRRLTNNPAIDVDPIWSPDGTKIAFLSLRDGNVEVYWINVDGSGLQRITRNSYDEFEIDWSPDGSRIALSSQVGEYADIYTLDVKAALQGNVKKQQLTDTEAHDAFPKWSPDGSRIAFISNREGDDNWEVYVMNSDGSDQRRLTYSDGLDGIPTWSPDGTHIAFESNRDGDNEIYVLTMEQALENPEGVEILRLTDNDAHDQQPAWRPSDAMVARIVAQLEGLPIDEFLQESWRQLQLRDPDTLFANGFAGVYDVALGDQFTNLSADYTRETQQLECEILDLLRAYDRGALSAEQKISYDSLQWVLATRVRGHAFTGYRFLVNPVWGLQNWPIDLLMEHPLENKQDVENYMARLSSLDTWVDQVIEGLEQNEQAGAIPPKYVLEDTVSQLDAILNLEGTTPRDADQIELYTDFRSKVQRIGDLGQDEREAMLDSVLAEIEETFIPAYQALRGYLVHLAAVAVEDPNQWRLPGGEDYYAYLLAYYTGTNLSADELHALGLAEVARLQAEIRDAAADLGYPADMSMAELNQRMSEDSPIVTGDALRRKYEEILTAADQAAGAYFDPRARAGVVIRVVPDGPPAYYAPPEPGSDGPGEMPVNLGFSPLYVHYNEHVLVHHETIPGHHTQLALAQELDLPGYQRFYSANPYLQNYDFQAYTEGWAWYAEVLAGEMGLYDGDPLANLGRLRLHLIRIVRIVVDTGLHAKGWTLDEAAAYLEEVTGMPQIYARLTRYLVNPGYPSGYTIGYLRILEMRQHAMEELGDRFDIQGFHNTVLGNGILPICVLGNVVDDWIAAGGPAESISSNTPVAQPPPGGGGRIAFASERDGTLDIYVMDTDSGSVTRLTNDPEHDSGPVWSPDGTRIAFMSERDVNHDLYVMDASGSNVTRLTTDPADEHGATWSPDGARLAFTSNRNGSLDIYVMDTDGSNVTRLTDSPASDANAAWSPDGARIAFASDRDGDLDIYVMDTDGSNVTRLTDNPAQDVDPAWSPDGTCIVFVSNRDSSDPADYSSPDNNWEIYVMEADGSNAIRLTDNPAYDVAARWSPDGRRIVFVSTRDGDMRIYVMDADGSHQARLTDDSATEESPAWSP